MKQISNQSESSKSIKRINERIANINRLIGKTDNSYITAYSRAIRESGLEFTRDRGTNRYRIRNTAENRKKIAQTEKLLKKYHAQTAQEIRKQTKSELKTEAAKKFAAIPAPARETKKQRQRREQRFIKQQTTKSKIQERIKIQADDRNIQNKLDVIYAATDSHMLGQQLSALTKNIGYSDRDKGAIFDIFGRINQEYRRVQLGMLTEQEQQRAEDLAKMRDDFAFNIDDGDDY